MKIFWSANIPSPYRIDFFNLLGLNNELTVLFENAFSSERNDIWKKYNATNFKMFFLKGIRYGTTSKIPFPLLKQFDSFFKINKFDVIVVSNYASITGILLTKYLRRKKIRYVIEGDGAFCKPSENLIKYKAKKKIISNASLCLSTSKEHDRYYLKYGCNQEDIKHYTLSSVLFNDSKRLQYDLQDIDGFDASKKTIVNIGQFIDRKNNELYLSLAKRLPEFNFLLIGEGPLLNKYREIISNDKIDNVFLLPFLKHKEIMSILQSSDLFVFTTKEDIWGLVINEALSSGVPVVSNNKCLAAVELIQNGKNGYVIESNDCLEYIKKIRIVLSNELNNFKQYCKANAFEYSIEKMVKQHETIFDEYTNKKSAIYLGYYTDHLNSSGVSFAGNKMQEHIIDCIDEQKFSKHVISIEPLSPWFKDQFYYSGAKTFSNNIKLTITYPPFLNVQFLKQLSQIMHSKSAFKKICRKYGADIVVGFNTFPVVGSLLNYAKKKHIKTCSFVADIPVSQTRYHFIKLLFRKIMDKKTIKYMRNVDGLIVINKKILKMYNLVQPSICINGFFNETSESKQNLMWETKLTSPSFLFAGSFNEYNCIRELLNVFSQSKTKNLYICGKGELQDVVSKYASNYSNIHFLGLVPQNKILSLEKQADFLILTRKTHNLITSLTFPSKLFEYSASMKPIIVNKGIELPDEIIKSTSIINLDNIPSALLELDEICNVSKDFLNKKSIKLHNYLLEEYSNKTNCNKITNFLNYLYEK